MQSLEMSHSVGHLVRRTRRGIDRHGIAGSVRRAGSLAWQQLYLREAHRWYQLDLDANRPRAELPEGFRLHSARAEELRLIEQLPTIGLEEARHRHRHGASLWMTLDGDRPVFACWTFYGRMPVLAAPGGWLELPVGTAGLEDSVTAPSDRGCSIAAPSVFSVFDRLADNGIRSVITKIAEDNGPARHVAEKMGFREIAGMGLLQVGSHRRVEVSPSGSGLSGFLVDCLSC
jgi:hypothetical protein